MHKLLRPTSAPTCLANYQSGTDNWKNVSNRDKYEIWLKLDQMQHNRCAYCEAQIQTCLGGDSHIEHFRQRARFEQGTFEWKNLFGSCNRKDSCGEYKDKQPAYSHQNLIKMDEQDPEDFLHFLADGNVVPKSNLSIDDEFRASETIRLFNLNGSLRQIREDMIKGYLKTAEQFMQMAEQYEPEVWLPLLENELIEVKQLPFSTAIKHTLANITDI